MHMLYVRIVTGGFYTCSEFPDYTPSLPVIGLTLESEGLQCWGDGPANSAGVERDDTGEIIRGTIYLADEETKARRR